MDAGRPQLYLLEWHRWLDVVRAEPELLANPRERAAKLLARGLAVLEAPAPVLSPANLGLYQWMPRIRYANATCSREASSCVASDPRRGVPAGAPSPRAARESGNSL